MNDGCVTLDEIFAAAGMRAASLVAETSGYLALAVGDATSRLPFAVDPRLVLVTTEGNVGITKRGELLPARRAAADLRAILARLLAAATGSAMPSLSGAARPREESDRGVDAVVEEIEAALIPVNRAAARRALARLARETIKAKESGRLRRPSARPPIEAPAPPPPVAKVEPAPIVAPLPVPTPAPIESVVVVAAPVESAPAVGATDREHLVEASTPPPEPAHDPTPTALGMGPMEGYTVIDVHTAELAAEAEEEAVVDPEPTGVPESTVLGQPTEDPAVAFAAATPLRGLPAIEMAAATPRARVAPSGPCAQAPTRADDLLASFGASCIDDASMREAAACLRRIAGIDGTPPPARVELRRAPAPLAAAPAVSLPPDWETPVTPRSAPRRAFRGPSVGLTLAALLVGLVGGGAVMRFRPDLLGAIAHPVAPTPRAP